MKNAGERSKLLHAVRHLLCLQVPGIGERLTTTDPSAEEGVLMSRVLAQVSGKLKLEPWLRHGCGRGLNSTISKGTSRSNQAPNLNLLK